MGEEIEAVDVNEEGRSDVGVTAHNEPSYSNEKMTRKKQLDSLEKEAEEMVVVLSHLIIVEGRL